jgi:hypothetical protein
MKKIIAGAFILMAFSTVPAMSEGFPQLEDAPVVIAAPDMPAVVTQPAPAEGWTETIAPAEPPATPVVPKAVASTPAGGSSQRDWTSHTAKTAPPVKFIYRERTEFSERLVNRRTYAPNDSRAIAAVPEPSSVLGLLGGLSGVGLSFARRLRVKK